MGRDLIADLGKNIEIYGLKTTDKLFAKMKLTPFDLYATYVTSLWVYLISINYEYMQCTYETYKTNCLYVDVCTVV